MRQQVVFVCNFNIIFFNQIILDMSQKNLQSIKEETQSQDSQTLSSHAASERKPYGITNVVPASDPLNNSLTIKNLYSSQKTNTFKDVQDKPKQIQENAAISERIKIEQVESESSSSSSNSDTNSAFNSNQQAETLQFAPPITTQSHQQQQTLFNVSRSSDKLIKTQNSAESKRKRLSRAFSNDDAINLVGLKQSQAPQPQDSSGSSQVVNQGLGNSQPRIKEFGLNSNVSQSESSKSSESNLGSDSEQSVTSNKSIENRSSEELEPNRFELDGEVHLQSLKNQDMQKHKLFTFRKHPFVQILGDLRDSNKILTVSLQVINDQNKTKSLRNKRSRFQKKILSSQISLKQPSMKRLESEMSEKIKHYAKEASNEFERDKVFQMMTKQFEDQNKSPTQFKLDNNHNEKEGGYGPQNINVPENEQNGNILVQPGIKLVPKDDIKSIISGTWKLSMEIDGVLKVITVMLDQKGLIKEVDETYTIIKKNKITGSFDLEGSSFTLSIDGKKHQMFQTNEDFTEMYHIEGEPTPNNHIVTKFIKNDPSKIKGAKRLAIIKVWMINEKKGTIESTKEYHFADPVITQKPQQGQKIMQIIHKSDDGEAFLLKKEDKSDRQQTKIFVIDQSWPKSSGPLPIDQVKSDQLNKDDRKRTDSMQTSFLSECFEKIEDLRIRNELFNQIQFFNKFKYLTIATENLCQILFMQHPYKKIEITPTDCYKGQMVLAIDKREQFAYILCKQSEKKIKHMRRSSFLTGAAQSSIKIISEQDEKLSNSKTLSKPKYAILKFNIQTKEDELFEISNQESPQVYEYIQEAEQNKNRVKCFYAEAQKTFILHFSKMKAVLVFTMHDSDLTILSNRKSTQLVLKKVIDKDKSLQVLCNEIIGGEKQYLSVGPPQIQVEQQDGYVSSKIELTDLLSSEPIVKMQEAMIQSSYFNNEKLVHTISFTKKGQVMFSAMTKYPDTEFIGVQMTATSVYDDLIKMFNQPTLGKRLQSVQLSKKLTHSQKHKDPKKINYNIKFLDEFSFEYPMLIYREEEPHKISLCNILQPCQPQFQINLGKICVKKFVGGAYLFSQFQTQNLNTNIAMICQNSEQNSLHTLMVLSFNPFNQDLLNDAKLYTVAGQIPIPVDYLNGRIQQAELLVNTLTKKVYNMPQKIQNTIVIQFSNNIYACYMSLNSLQDDENLEKDLNVKLNKKKIVKLKMIRDYNQNIYFAEQESYNRTDIINIYQDPHKKGISRKSIYFLHGCHILALEKDTSNDQDDRFSVVKKSFFILDSLQRVHYCVKLPNHNCYASQMINFAQHKLSHMSFKRWNSTPISMKTMLYDGNFYSLFTDSQWNRELENNDHQKERAYKHVTSFSNIGCQQTVSLDANYSAGSFRFAIQNAPSSKKMLLTETLNSYVKQMVFVTDNHILMRLQQIEHLRNGKISHIWRLFDVRNGTQITYKKNSKKDNIMQKLETNEYELACTDFSNVDEIDQRFVVMRSNQDRSTKQLVLHWNKKGQVKLQCTIPKQKFVLKEDFPIQAVRKDMEMKVEEGGNDTKTLIYPGCAYSKINLDLKVIDAIGHSNKSLVPFGKNQKASRIFVDRSKAGEKIVVAAKVTLKKEKLSPPESKASNINTSETYLIVNDGRSENEQKQISKYIIKFEDGSNQETMDEFIWIPPTQENWLSFQVDSCGDDKGWQLSEIQLYTANEAIPEQIRQSLLEKPVEATQDFDSWKENQKWILNADEINSIDKYCLPTTYKLPPLVMSEKKMIISIGEIDQEKLPNINWTEDKNESQRGNKRRSYLFKSVNELTTSLKAKVKVDDKNSTIRLSIQHQNVGDWDFVNLIVYETQPNKRRIGTTILPSQVALINDTIYLSNVAHSQTNIMKITFRAKQATNSNLQKENLKSNSSHVDFTQKWTIQLSTVCEELQYGDPSHPITISRLKKSWIEKLRTYTEADSKKKVQKKEEKTKSNSKVHKHYENLLQINYQKQAILFAIHHEHGAVFAEEIDQISNEQDFFSKDHFIPTGFVPTCWRMNSNNNVIKSTVQTNDKEDLYLIIEEEIEVETQETVSVRYFGPYNMYSEYDLQNVLQLKKICRAKQKIDFGSVSKLYSQYNVFSIFFDDEIVLEYLQDKLKNIEGDMIKSDHMLDQYMEENELTPLNLQKVMWRRFFINLITPVGKKMSFSSKIKLASSKSQQQNLNKKSIIKWSFKNKNVFQSKREHFLNIALCCPDFSLRHCLTDIDDIIELIENDTPISKEVLSKAFFQTLQSKQITSLNWNKHGQNIEAFRMNTTYVDAEQVSKKISDPKKQSKIEFVDIKLVNLRWMKQDGNRFCDLIYRFKQLDRDRWFGHELLVSLFQTHWVETRYFIILRGLIPFSIYFISSLLYTQKFLNSKYKIISSDFDLPQRIGFLIPYSLSYLYFSYFELLQFYKQYKNAEDKRGCKRICKAMVEHFDRYWNFVDLLLMLCVPAIITLSILDYYLHLLNPYALILLALANQIAMWYKLFDWLRLSSKTAIYPILLREVMIDIYPFLVTMAIILGLFGNSLSIFQSISKFEGLGELYEERIKIDLFNAIMVQILTMVGDVQTDSYYIEGGSSNFTTVLWLWFLMAILMTNIIFLNLLIAIISDTFDRVWEHRQTYILSSQADILCDWINVIEREKDGQKNLYMYMVTRTFQEINDTWEGKISQIKKLLDTKFYEVQEQAKANNIKIQKKLNEQTLIADSQKNELILTRNLLVELSSSIKEKSNVQPTTQRGPNTQISNILNANKAQEQVLSEFDLFKTQKSFKQIGETFDYQKASSSPAMKRSLSNLSVESRISKIEDNVQQNSKQMSEIKKILLQMCQNQEATTTPQAVVSSTNNLTDAIGNMKMQFPSDVKLHSIDESEELFDKQSPTSDLDKNITIIPKEKKNKKKKPKINVSTVSKREPIVGDLKERSQSHQESSNIDVPQEKISNATDLSSQHLLQKQKHDSFNQSRNAIMSIHSTPDDGLVEASEIHINLPDSEKDDDKRSQ